MADTALPQDWDQLLKRFTQTLAHAQQSLDKAADLEATTATVDRAEHYAPVLTEQTVKVEGLGTKAAEVSQWMDALDSELRVSEELLRVLLSQTETVRQNLAAWAGRAIG